MRAVISWSGGKDCMWALRECDVDVIALVTTYDPQTARIPIHDVPLQWIETQAAQLQIPLWSVPLAFPCPNADYAAALLPIYGKADAVIFGDLFLADIRRFREDMLRDAGITPLFPLWGRDTRALATEMIDNGMNAVITAVDPAKLDSSFIGKRFGVTLPHTVDPCGENGEFHTFVHDPHRLINSQRD